VRTRGNWFQDISTFMITVCAIVVAVTVVRRDRNGPNRPAQLADRKVDDWGTIKSTGHLIGSPRAPVAIVEFADFECPACRVFALGTLRALRSQRSEQVSVVFRHWPLTQHRFAMAAASAAECASAQGRFEAIHDLLYLKQDSLGFKNFQDFARESGVPDLNAFSVCMADSTVRRPIDRDVRAIAANKGLGTPTIIVNGVLLGGVPDSARMFRIVDSLSGNTVAVRQE
jgi:protein-disulfide isomerase